jgi:regulator of RNase E activity RraA
MDVAPGEIVHMDENGAVKFPADRADAVLANAKTLLAGEERRLEMLRKATTAEAVRAAFEGESYSSKK